MWVGSSPIFTTIADTSSPGGPRDLAEGLPKFASKATPSKEAVIDALEASEDRVAEFLADVANGVAKRRGFKKGVSTTLAYLIAHESHHRGSIILTLKQSGYPVEKDVRYRIWDWDRV